MIDCTIFECEIEPTYEKDLPQTPPKTDDHPRITCPAAKDHQLQTLCKHLEQVYQVDRALLWKMSHCTAFTQMTEIVSGLKIVRLLEKAIQRQLFDHLKERSQLSPAMSDPS
uniref:Transposase n=1 Tax=Haemonchus contortus TaxID=6289 RepID=A0A7I4YTY7_HAECO|nr:unnamed protein product [Haemonchus contortus]